MLELVNQTMLGTVKKSSKKCPSSKLKIVQEMDLSHSSNFDPSIHKPFDIGSCGDFSPFAVASSLLLI